MWPVQIRATSRTFKDYADAWSDRQVGTSDLSFGRREWLSSGYRSLAGRNADCEVCRGHGLSTATFYKLEAKYGGMEVASQTQQQARRTLEQFEGSAPGALAPDVKAEYPNSTYRLLL